MSIKIMAWVWEHSPYKETKLLLHLALADMAAEGSGYCWPAVATLGKKSRVSERQARRLLRQMETAGDIGIEKRDRNGRQTSNGYYVYMKLRADIAVSPESSEEPSDYLPAPLAQAAKGDYFTMTEEPEYVSAEEEEASPTHGPSASTPEQTRWLAATGAKFFQRGHKSRVKSILASVKRGDALTALRGDAAVYQQCLAELGSVNAAALKSPPSILPRSWLENRYENARKWGWTRDNLLDYALKRDKLVDHCRRKLRTLGVAPSAADIAVPEGMVRLVTEDGVRFISKEEAAERLR